MLDDSSLDGIDDVKEVASLSDDFKIDLDDDLESIDLGGAKSVVEDKIEETDFLYDDESFDDLLKDNDDKDDKDKGMSGLSVAGLAATGMAAAGLKGKSSADELSDVSDAANLNLEIGADDFDKIMPENHAYKSTVDNVKDTLSGKEDIDLDDNLLADFDDNLSFLDLDDDTEVIGDTQIETKIDLAKAYIDMGDIEGARSTLEEVMEDGNDEQKRQAEELLHQNG